MNRRVLHVGVGNRFGGVETFQVALARYRAVLPAAEPQFGVCFPGRLFDELAQTGVPVHRLGAVRLSLPWQVWLARRTLRRIARDAGIGTVVVHSGWSHAVFGPAVRASGARLVRWLHAVIDPGHPIERRALKSPVSLWIANSAFTSAGTASRLGTEAPPVVHCAVEPPPLPPQASRARIRAELGVREPSVVVIAASRIERLKGLDVLIEALGRLADIPGWCLWIAGGADSVEEKAHRAELDGRVSALGLAGRIRFLGVRADIPGLLEASDIFCQPNRAPDSFGVSFVEALYAGRPVVTSALGGAMEVVTPDCGILTAAGDVAGVAAALRRLMEDEAFRTKLGRCGPVRAEYLCDPKRQVGRAHAALFPCGGESPSKGFKA